MMNEISEYVYEFVKVLLQSGEEYFSNVQVLMQFFRMLTTQMKLYQACVQMLSRSAFGTQANPAPGFPRGH